MKLDAWKHVARFLARLYPSRWRERYGAEFDGLLEDNAPRPRDAFDILWGAFRMQISTWTFARITVIYALIGVLASIAISFTWPVHYVSEAKIRITPEQIPESIAPIPINQPILINQVLWNRIASMQREILSPSVLTSIIEHYDLYPRERTRMPLDDVVKNMREHVVVTPLVSAPPENRVIPAFVVQFDYPDPYVAWRVTDELMSRFIEANMRHAITDRDINPLLGMRLEPLDVASLPTRPSGRSSAILAAAAVGLFAGLLAGLALAIVIRSRRRITV